MDTCSAGAAGIAKRDAIARASLPRLKAGWNQLVDVAVDLEPGESHEPGHEHEEAKRRRDAGWRTDSSPGR